VRRVLRDQLIWKGEVEIADVQRINDSADIHAGRPRMSVWPVACTSRNRV
jgi:hypothetical protein